MGGGCSGLDIRYRGDRFVGRQNYLNCFWLGSILYRAMFSFLTLRRSLSVMETCIDWLLVFITGIVCVYLRRGCLCLMLYLTISYSVSSCCLLPFRENDSFIVI